jgi:hypothetical protein
VSSYTDSLLVARVARVVRKLAWGRSGADHLARRLVAEGGECLHAMPWRELIDLIHLARREAVELGAPPTGAIFGADVLLAELVKTRARLP